MPTLRIQFKRIKCYLAMRITLKDRGGDDKAMITLTWHRGPRWHVAQVRREMNARNATLTEEAEVYANRGSFPG